MATLTIKDLSKQEIRDLLIGRFAAQSMYWGRIKKRMASALGVSKDEKEVGFDDELTKAIYGWIAWIMAGRLIDGDSSIPLITAEDLSVCSDEVFAFFELTGSMSGTSRATEKMARGFMRAVLPKAFAHIVENISDNVVGQRTLGEDYVLWINTCIKIAEEKNIPAAIAVTHQDTRDEISRRMYIQEDLFTSDLRRLNQMLDPDIIRQKYLEPFLDIAREELKRMGMSDYEVGAILDDKQDVFEQHLIKHTAEQCLLITPILQAFIEEENERIYGRPVAV